MTLILNAANLQEKQECCAGYGHYFDKLIYTLFYKYQKSKFWISTVKQHMHLLISSAISRATEGQKERESDREKDRGTGSKGGIGPAVGRGQVHAIVVPCRHDPCLQNPMPLPGARLPAALQDGAPSAGVYARQPASELPPAKALSVE